MISKNLKTITLPGLIYSTNTAETNYITKFFFYFFFSAIIKLGVRNLQRTVMKKKILSGYLSNKNDN